MITQTPQEDNLEFLQSWLAESDPSSADRDLIEAEVIDFAAAIEGREQQLEALKSLAATVTQRSIEVQSLIDSRLDENFGDGIAEICIDDLGDGIDRLLRAKNPAIVIRHGTYDDESNDIMNVIGSIVGSSSIKSTLFPSPGMKSEDSQLHLDNFIGSSSPGFRYSLTAARVSQGSVVFLSGFASKASQKLSEAGYKNRQDAINSNPSVQKLYRDVRHTERIADRHFSIEDMGTDLFTVSLGVGDVVIWPQGGKGSEVPVWHAVRQLGDPEHLNFVPRKTVSYHFE